MRTLLLIPALAAALWAVPAAAQTAEDDVLDVVTRLFDGMRATDTTAMRATFHPDARLVTTGTRDGEPVSSIVPLERWLEGVAGATEVLDERLYGTEVRVDGNLAAVWTRYTFYIGDRLSHCGVDAFQLVRTQEGWKISQVADTRHTDGCPTTEGDR